MLPGAAEAAGLAGALAPAGGSSGPIRPQPAAPSEASAASASARQRPIGEGGTLADTSDSGWARHYIETARIRRIGWRKVQDRKTEIRVPALFTCPSREMSVSLPPILGAPSARANPIRRKGRRSRAEGRLWQRARTDPSGSDAFNSIPAGNEIRSSRGIVGRAVRSAKFHREPTTVGFAPGVSHDLAAFASFAETVFHAITRRCGNDVGARIVRGRLAGAGDRQSKEQDGDKTRGGHDDNLSCAKAVGPKFRGKK